LTRKDVDELHAEQVAMYGGSDGTRDDGLLESAIQMPQQSFGGEYLHIDLFEMAAAYLFHICANHPYVDGNKRTAAEAADVFLFANGFDLEMDTDDFVTLVLEVAESHLTKKQIAEVLREHAREREL
jgi:death-on-curing protein